MCSGIDLIQAMADRGNTSPSMLVSNYAEAQQAAEAAGALPGFGKSQVADPETRRRISGLIAEYRAM